MTRANRNYKDTIFSDLFYRDRDAKKNILSLYNALYNDHLDDPEQIELIRLENTMFMDMYNDSAFCVRDRRIVLSEHQSTINYNLPLRDLLYIAGEYEQYFPTDIRYKKKAVQIPTPDFITFYNGKEEFPAEATMRLSDSYIEKDPVFSLELLVRVININPDSGHSVLEKCTVLREYSYLIEETRGYGGDKDALAKAVKACMDKGILSEYLRRKGKRAVNMLFAEYDYDKDIAVQRQEAAEEAIAKMNVKLTAALEDIEKARRETEAEKKKTEMEKRRAEEAEKARFASVQKLKGMGLEDDVIPDITGFSKDEIQTILNGCDPK